jgi:hypothetical protein
MDGKTMSKNKFHIHENKQSDGIETPRFSVSYSERGKEEKLREQSIAIVSALSGGRGCVLEVQSALFAKAINKRQDDALDFLHAVERTGLDFRYRSSMTEQSGSFFGKIFGMKKPKALNHFILVAVNPASLAVGAQFAEILPYFGARYYFLKEGVTPDSLLDPLFNGQLYGNNIYDKVELSIFDCVYLGQTGIYVPNNMTRKEIEEKFSF